MEGTIAQVIAGEATWCVVHGDCLDVMKTLPDKSVDHVITDPPYDQHTSESARTIRGAINNHRAVADEGQGRRRYIPFDGVDPGAFVPELLRLASRWVIAFCALEQIGAYKMHSGDAWVRAGFWHRLGGAPQFSGDRPAQSGEGVSIMHRAGKKRWNRGGHAAFWECPRMATGVQPMSAERVHPTQKPVELMMDLLDAFSDPGELTLDPFCGSGTTGIGCIRLGRRFVGIEQNEQYVAVARERLRAEESCSTYAARASGQTALFSDVAARNGGGK